MKYINHPLLALLLLAGFIALSYVSLHRETGYTHSVFDVLPRTLQQRQAEALKDLWHITDAEIRAPIRIFGE